jgi:hypothetical protein
VDQTNLINRLSGTLVMTSLPTCNKQLSQRKARDGIRKN